MLPIAQRISLRRDRPLPVSVHRASSPHLPYRPLSLYLLTLSLGLCFTGCSSPEPATMADGGNAHAVHPEDEQPEKHGNGHGDDRPQIVTLPPGALDGIELQTTTVRRQHFIAEHRTTGQVDFDQDRVAHVSPRISGRVHRVTAPLGAQVGVGQTLAEIDSIELGRAKAAYLQAKAQEDVRRVRWQRAKSLLQDQIISRQAALELEAELKEAAAGLRTAEETLHLYGLGRRQVESLTYDDPTTSLYPLRAPFAGTVVERHVTRGELVTPQDNLFTLADLSAVWIWIDISQRDLAAVHLGDQARAHVDTFPDDGFTGVVSYLSPHVDTATRTVRARLDVANPDGKLRPGMFVEVRLLDPHAADGDGQGSPVPAVPEDALLRDGSEHFVFLHLGDGSFLRRAVRRGRTAAGQVEMISGVEAGDEVVVRGGFLLKSSLSKDSLGGGHSH